MPPHALKVWKHKKIQRKEIEKAWRDWQAGRRQRERLIPHSNKASFLWQRVVFALGHSTLVTVRRFPSIKGAVFYMKHSKHIDKELMASNPKKFVLQPVQFFSRRGANILERVYPGPDFHMLQYKHGRYYEALKKRLKRKGINLDKKEDYLRVFNAFNDGRNEAIRIAQRKGLVFNLEIPNMLVLDFDPKTEKVVLGFIDRETPMSIQE